MRKIINSEDFAKVLNYYNIFEQSSTYKIVCPFHNDINASLLINLVEGRFFCFGCHASGTAIDFVRLAEKEWDDLEVYFKYNKILRSKKNKNISVEKSILTKNVYNDGLLDLEIAKDYYLNLNKTNWDEDTPEKEYLLTRGLTVSTLIRSGAKINFNESYPIIFPMRDMGEFKGWVCRTTSKDVEKKRKYLYNKGFRRATTLVGNYNNKIVFIVEGYFDYLKLKQLGLKYVVAILGWKISHEQIEKLKKRGVKTIISALDNDDCGQKGTEFLRSLNFDVIRFPCPKGCKDAGELTERQFKLALLKLKEDHSIWV